MAQQQSESLISLPKPRTTSTLSVEEALCKRRTVRSFLRLPLNMADVSQLLWAAQGLTDRDGNRTAPSPGQTHSLEMYLAAWNIEGLPPGIYHYCPRGHALEPRDARDVRAELTAASCSQEWIAGGAALLALVAVPERARAKFGERCSRFIHMEAGHVSENIFLQAHAMRLGNAFVGSFDAEKVRAIFGLTPDEDPLGLIPFGKKR